MLKFGKDVLCKFDWMLEVQLLCVVSGEYDYVVWLCVDLLEWFNDLFDQIGMFEGVECMMMLIILLCKIDCGMIGG